MPTRPIWFRTRPGRRNAVAPVTPEGWRVAWTFAGLMFGAPALAGLLTYLAWRAGAPPAFLVIIASAAPFAMAGAGWWFVHTAMRHSDNLKWNP